MEKSILLQTQERYHTMLVYRLKSISFLDCMDFSLALAEIALKGGEKSMIADFILYLGVRFMYLKITRLHLGLDFQPNLSHLLAKASRDKIKKIYEYPSDA
jgi:hypothetical protein